MSLSDKRYETGGEGTDSWSYGEKDIREAVRELRKFLYERWKNGNIPNMEGEVINLTMSKIDEIFGEKLI